MRKWIAKWLGLPKRVTSLEAWSDGHYRYMQARFKVVHDRMDGIDKACSEMAKQWNKEVDSLRADLDAADKRLASLERDLCYPGPGKKPTWTLVEQCLGRIDALERRNAECEQQLAAARKIIADFDKQPARRKCKVKRRGR